MSQVLPGDVPPVHDLIGIGFGPSNVAMAIALSEHNARVGGQEAISAHFFGSALTSSSSSRASAGTEAC
jgi:L-ornithine N5-monooxygenase